MVPWVHSQRPGSAPPAHSPPRRPRGPRSGSSRPGRSICSAGVCSGACPGAARPPGAAPWGAAPSRYRRGAGPGDRAEVRVCARAPQPASAPAVPSARGAQGPQSPPEPQIPPAAPHSEQDPQPFMDECPLYPHHCPLSPHCPPLSNPMAPRLQLPPSPERPQVSTLHPLPHPNQALPKHRPLWGLPCALIFSSSPGHRSTASGPSSPIPTTSSVGICTFIPLNLPLAEPRAPRSRLRPHQPPLPPPPAL